MDSIAIIGAVVVGGLTLGFFLKRRQDSQILPVFEKIAIERDGIVKTSILLSPKLIIQDGDIRFTVSLMSTGTSGGSIPITYVDGQLPVSTELDFRLQNRAALDLVNQWLPNSLNLDDLFRFSAKDNSLASKLVPAELRSLFGKWKNLGLDIQLVNGRLTLSVHKELMQECDLNELIDQFVYLSKSIRS